MLLIYKLGAWKEQANKVQAIITEKDLDYFHSLPISRRRWCRFQRERKRRKSWSQTHDEIKWIFHASVEQPSNNKKRNEQTTV